MIFILIVNQGTTQLNAAYHSWKKTVHSLMTDERTGFAGTVVDCILWMMSGIYGVALVFVRCFQQNFSQKKLRCPVVSVGNITVGGVGKTPMVMALIQLFKQQGVSAGVLARGYQGVIDKKTGGIKNDEVLLLQQEFPRLPLGVHKNRSHSAAQVLAFYPAVQVLIMDDGFQQFGIHRDLNIVLIDTTNPFGNGSLLPRGILREPLSALARADVVVLTKVDFSPSTVEALQRSVRQIHPLALIVEAVHEPLDFVEVFSGQRRGFDFLKRKNVCAMSGIADPKSFVRSLELLEVKITQNFSFPDHHWYTVEELEQINAYMKDSGVECLVMTQKDAVKLKNFQKYFFDPAQVFALRIGMKIITNQKEFYDRVLSVLSR